MGWTNYLINKEKKLAITISRYIDIDDIEIDFDDLNELIQYLFNEEDLNVDIVKYIMNKLDYIESVDVIGLSYLYQNLGFDELIHEDKLPKDYLIIK